MPQGLSSRCWNAAFNPQRGFVVLMRTLENIECPVDALILPHVGILNKRIGFHAFNVAADDLRALCQVLSRLKLFSMGCGVIGPPVGNQSNKI